MEKLDDGKSLIAGFEANGGFLLQSPLKNGDKTLRALPTRDAMLPLIAMLKHCRENNLSVTEFQAQLPERFTHGDRLKDFPTELAKKRLEEITEGDQETINTRVHKWFGDIVGKLVSIDHTDGIRMTFEDNDIIHLRASGNAPELRCYNECANPECVLKLNSLCMARLEQWRDENVKL